MVLARKLKYMDSQIHKLCPEKKNNKKKIDEGVSFEIKLTKMLIRHHSKGLSQHQEIYKEVLFLLQAQSTHLPLNMIFSPLEV